MIAEPSPLRKPLARNRPLASYGDATPGPAEHESVAAFTCASTIGAKLDPGELSEIQGACERRSGHHRLAVNQSDVMYRLAFACPVPVGDRVRLTWFSRDNPGLFQDAELPSEPMVEDLDTGVTYTPSWLVSAEPREAAHDPAIPSERVIGGLSVVTRAEGRVVRTQVVPHPADFGSGAATLLTVTPLVLPQAPFR